MDRSASTLRHRLAGHRERPSRAIRARPNSRRTSSRSACAARSARRSATTALIAPGDRVMVCLSGGKDSYALLDILLSLKDRAPLALRGDRRQPRPEAAGLSRRRPAALSRDARRPVTGSQTQDTYSVVKRVIPEGGTLCSLCSRLRRGVLYRVAGEIGATKIALGHHRDDILATFFLNLFFGGKLKTMPPKLVSDDGKHVVIRPLAYVRERDLARYAEPDGVSDHPVQPLRLAGAPAAQAGHRDAARVGAEASRPHRFDLRGAGHRRPVAPHGPRAVRFRGGARNRPRRCRAATSRSTSTAISSVRSSSRRRRRFLIRACRDRRRRRESRPRVTDARLRASLMTDAGGSHLAACLLRRRLARPIRAAFALGRWLRIDQFTSQVLIDDEWHAVHQLLQLAPAQMFLDLRPRRLQHSARPPRRARIACVRPVRDLRCAGRCSSCGLATLVLFPLTSRRASAAPLPRCSLSCSRSRRCS